MSNDLNVSRKLLLTIDNYYVWSLAMEGKLDNHNALDIVLGIEPPPKEAKEKAIYDKLNRLAYNLILDHLDTDNLSYVAGSLPPKKKRNGLALWSLLKDHYQSNGFINKTLAFSQFNEVKYEENIEIFVNKVRTTVQKMKLVDFKMD